jgi:hypothetical protein
MARMYDQTQNATPTSSPRQDHPRPDPFAPLPDWVRPPLVSLVLGGLYCAGALLIVLVWMYQELDSVVEGILPWGIASVVPCLPLAAAIALISRRVERVQTGREGPKGWLWVPYAVGVAFFAHWAPACLWSPVLVLAATLDGRMEDRLAGAVFGLVAWVAAGASLALVVTVRKLLEEREWGAARVRAVQPGLVPTSLVLSLGYAVALMLPTLMWLAWLDSAWERGTGSIAVLAFVLAAGAASMLAGALTGSWLLTVAPHAPAAAYGSRMRQIEITGGAFVAHWAVLFFALLVPETGLEDDLRFSMLFVAFGAITLGTALWSVGRTARVAQTWQPGAVHGRA